MRSKWQERILLVSKPDITYDQLAAQYGTSAHTIDSSLRAVAHAYEAVKTNGACDMTPYQDRVWQIYCGLTNIPTLIRSHVRRRTELGSLLRKNTGVATFLEFLSSGKSTLDYTNENRIPYNTDILHRVGQSTVQACLGIKSPSYNPYLLIRRKILADYDRDHTDTHGRTVGEKSLELIYNILDYTDKSSHKVSDSLSRVRGFFELCAVLDFHLQNGHKLKADFLQLSFPGINLVNKEPLSMNFREYYRTWFESGQIPRGLRSVITAFIQGNLHNAIFPTLMSHIPYTRGSMDKMFLYSLYFLENLLVANGNSKIDYTLLTRNPHSETAKILELIYEERKGN